MGVAARLHGRMPHTPQDSKAEEARRRSNPTCPACTYMKPYHFELIVMRDKRLGSGAAWDDVEDRGFHLHLLV